MKQFTCVLTCFHISEKDRNTELLTLDVNDTTYESQHRAEFVTPTDIPISVRLFVPEGGDPSKMMLKLPKIYNNYLSKWYKFNLYVIETFPNEHLNRKELYKGSYLGEKICVS